MKITKDLFNFYIIKDSCSKEIPIRTIYSPEQEAESFDKYLNITCSDWAFFDSIDWNNSFHASEECFRIQCIKKEKYNEYENVLNLNVFFCNSVEELRKHIIETEEKLILDGIEKWELSRKNNS